MSLITVREASKWASSYLGKEIKPSNISYLVQYAKIKKHEQNEKIYIDLDELKEYYDKIVKSRENKWKNALGKDLNWGLSFENFSEIETTKHVHRLHPYKGKFIPQLVEYFLDEHLNDFKKEIYFRPGDTILDPFCGSGTTLVQSAELRLNSIGIDVSQFNCLMTKVKMNNYDFIKLSEILEKKMLKAITETKKELNDEHDFKLKEKLSEFNKKYFPNPEFKHDVRDGRINEKIYSKEKLSEFIKDNKDLIKSTNKRNGSIKSTETTGFLDKWYSNRIKKELLEYLNQINGESDEKIKDVMQIVLSRTARSVRATTHSDLATLVEPQIGPYYCTKHRKICMPINTMVTHLKKNTYDTISRLKQFARLKKKVFFEVINGDSRTVDIFDYIKKNDSEFYTILKKDKISGIFTSPPYVGQIDYHEQHAYAYELFDIPREDEKEIGPMNKGQNKKAKEDYVEGISQVFLNASKFIKNDGDIFVVANDKFNLYPTIAEKSNLKIVNTFKRPVLNRTERDRQPYCEIIFHMKKISN